MEEIKDYVESRIDFLVKHRGKLSKEEEELQRVLKKINELMETK